MPLENPKRSEPTRIILRCEFSPPMPTSLLALFVTLRSILRSRVDLQVENLALRHQIGVLQRSVKKRPKLTSMDRLLWVSLSRLWRGWRSTLVLVKPETVVAWHRRGFRWFWTWKVRHGQPRRPIVSREVRESDPQHVPTESYLGCTAHSRRTAQTRHRHRPDQRHQVHGALPQATLANLARLPGEPHLTARFHRFLYGPDHSFSGPLGVPGPGPRSSSHPPLQQ